MQLWLEMGSEKEQITGTYPKMRHLFELVLHSNLDLVYILSNFDCKASIKNPYNRSIKTTVNEKAYAYPCIHIFHA